MKLSRRILYMIILSFTVLVALSTLWQYIQFGPVTVSSIIFTLTAPVDGTDLSVVMQYVILVALPTVAVFILGMLLFYAYKRKYPTRELSSKIKKRLWIFNMLLLVSTLVICNNVYDVVGYVYNQTQEANLYDQYNNDASYQRYYKASDQKVTGKNTKNLVYIFLESFENTYLDKANGGLMDTNLISELSTLAKENTSFSNTELLGGPMQVEGTSWTIASMVNQHSGLTLSPTLFDSMGSFDHFMPGSKMLGDFLLENNYKQTFMIGSSAKFAGTDKMFEQHGQYEIIDKSYFENRYPNTDEYYNHWGAKDYILFDEAKNVLTNLADEALENNQHFNFTMATIDTHHPYGFTCKKCDPNIKDQYERVLSCESKLVDDFVSWCKNQSWYQDTTIVIVGDHNTMANKYAKKFDKNYVRTTYNCFINPAQSSKHTKNRIYTRMDFYPTILSALGFKIEHDKLGLGTNLFSGKPTVAETIGINTLNDELNKNSSILEKEIYGFKINHNDKKWKKNLDRLRSLLN